MRTHTALRRSVHAGQPGRATEGLFESQGRQEVGRRSWLSEAEEAAATACAALPDTSRPCKGLHHAVFWGDPDLEGSLLSRKTWQHLQVTGPGHDEHQQVRHPVTKWFQCSPQAFGAFRENALDAHDLWVAHQHFSWVCCRSVVAAWAAWAPSKQQHKDMLQTALQRWRSSLLAGAFAGWCNAAVEMSAAKRKVPTTSADVIPCLLALWGAECASFNT